MPEYKCNLVIPGVAKSGTSSLHAYLDTHPNVCMSAIKEPHYFSKDDVWEKGFTYHNRLFDSCNKDAAVFGESSTTYFITEAALQRISRNLCAPKIIIVLRDPVARAVSHYKWLYALGLESKSLTEAVDIGGHLYNPNRPVMGCYYGYLEFSTYTKWVPRWIKEFGNENILLLDSEGLRIDKEEGLNKCIKFLGLKPINWFLPEEKNKTHDAMMKSEGIVSKVIKRLTPHGLKQAVKSYSPSAIGAWNGFFVTHHRREVPQISDADLINLRALLSDETSYYYSLFGRTS